MLEEMMIFVTFEVLGIHCYPEAPEDVAYLRHPHRHIFKYKVGIEVEHDNRAVEFHQFKKWCLGWYGENNNNNNKSCEMLARELATKIHHQYNPVKIEIEVWEDGECGARLVQFRRQ